MLCVTIGPDPTVHSGMIWGRGDTRVVGGVPLTGDLLDTGEDFPIPAPPGLCHTHGALFEGLVYCTVWLPCHSRSCVLGSWLRGAWCGFCAEMKGRHSSNMLLTNSLSPGSF